MSVVDGTGQVDAHVDATVLGLEVRFRVKRGAVTLKVGLVVQIVGAVVFRVLLPLFGCLTGAVPGYLLDTLFMCIEFAVLALITLAVKAFEKFLAILTHRGQFVRVNHEGVWHADSVRQFFLDPCGSARNVGQ